jgi:short-subunit dehydrogenase
LLTRPGAVALVTGASGGIGEAIARLMAEQGEDVVLLARSADRLARVASDIAAATGRLPVVIVADLEERGAVDHVRRELAGRDLSVRHLVNNAGFGLAGDLVDLPRHAQLGIVDVNCRALLDLTLAFLPDILANHGGVLNVASLAGFTPGPGLAVYYASKAFVVSLTRSLAWEMRGRGVAISALCPGPTATGFGLRAGFDGLRAARLTRPLDAMAVARIGVAGYRAGRVVIVPGWVNRLIVMGLGLVPTRLVLPLIARIQRGRRRPGGPVS